MIHINTTLLAIAVITKAKYTNIEDCGQLSNILDEMKHSYQSDFITDMKGLVDSCSVNRKLEEYTIRQFREQLEEQKEKMTEELKSKSKMLLKYFSDTKNDFSKRTEDDINELLRRANEGDFTEHATFMNMVDKAIAEAGFEKDSFLKILKMLNINNRAIFNHNLYMRQIMYNIQYPQLAKDEEWKTINFLSDKVHCEDDIDNSSDYTKQSIYIEILTQLKLLIAFDYEKAMDSLETIASVMEDIEFKEIHLRTIDKLLDVGSYVQVAETHIDHVSKILKVVNYGSVIRG